nr:immunoglobulin heavy chain junction region [Mus musculus]MBK4195861.1 immunoglobulin heavy chain junction region [Mus musculus]
CARRALPDYW